MKKLIYISHPSLGKEENKLDVEFIVRKLYECEYMYNNFCFVSPVHCYGFMYHDVEYVKGLTFCTDLLEHCEELWVFEDWENSRGCTEEVGLAIELGIKIRFLGYSEDIDDTISKLVKQFEYVSNVPTKKYVNTKSNKRLYTCISIPEYKKNCKDKSFIVDKVLYTDLNDAIDNYIISAKIKRCSFNDKLTLRSRMYNNNVIEKKSIVSSNDDTENFVVLQVDIDDRKVFDLSSKKDINEYNEYTVKKCINDGNILYRYSVNEVKWLKEFIQKKGNIDLIKRIVQINNLGISIPTKIKEVYSVVNEDCIIDYKKFTSREISKIDKRYIISDKLNNSLGE